MTNFFLVILEKNIYKKICKVFTAFLLHSFVYVPFSIIFLLSSCHIHEKYPKKERERCVRKRERERDRLVK